MSDKKNGEKYVSLEDFFESHESRAIPFLGERVAQYAYSLKDLDIMSPDAERPCRVVQNAVGKLVQGRPADWVILTSESHEILSLEEWVEDVVLQAHQLAVARDTGYGDLDLNVETQMSCGMQLESFHAGDWAKARLLKMFSLSNFEEEEPMECPLHIPLPQLLAKMDRDLELVVKGGMRHPYKCSFGVSALCLRVGASADSPETIIPMVRRTKLSDVGSVIIGMKDELKERFKGLVVTIEEQQKNLKMLPEGWPTVEIWQQMQEWATKRYTGDNGLIGSDFFDGKWGLASMPHDVHRLAGEAPLELAPQALALPVLDVGRRMAKRRLESTAGGAAAEEADGPRLPNLRI